MKSLDKYLFQALDNYPYWLEGTIESLDYALSYDGKNAAALCLYGRVLAEQIKDYEGAKAYFEEAIAADVHAVAVYPYYIQTLLDNQDFEEAERLIEFALTLKGIAKLEILAKKALFLEAKQEFKAAKKVLKEMKLLALNNDFNYFIEEAEKRIAQKTKKDSKKEGKKKKTSKKKSSK